MQLIKTCLSNGHLTDDEKMLTIEERDKIILDELESTGFISDYRLPDKNNFRHCENISFEYKDGVIKFTDLPKQHEELILICSEEKLIIYNKMFPLLTEAYPNCQVIHMTNVKSYIPYDLSTLCEDVSKTGLLGTGHRFLCNSPATPYYFNRLDASIIDVYLLKDGFILIDLINMRCNSISFSPSVFFENALDIHVDREPKEGELYLSGIKKNLIIYHPILSLALKSQASIGVIDRNSGSLYAHVAFYYCPEYYGESFVDMFRSNGRSNKTHNLEIFTDYEF